MVKKNSNKNTIVLEPKPAASYGKWQVIPDEIHAAAANLVQSLADGKVDISGLLSVANNFVGLQTALLALQPVSEADLALSELVPLPLRPNGIASAQSMRCKSFAAGNYMAWLRAAYEEIILRHGYKTAKSSGSPIGLDSAFVSDMSLELVKRLLNSRSSAKCVTGKWQDGPEKVKRLEAIEADIELLTARRKELDPSYGSKQPKVRKQLTAIELLKAADIDPESEQGKAFLAIKSE